MVLTSPRSPSQLQPSQVVSVVGFSSMASYELKRGQQSAQTSRQFVCARLLVAPVWPNSAQHLPFSPPRRPYDAPLASGYCSKTISAQCCIESAFGMRSRLFDWPRTPSTGTQVTPPAFGAGGL